MTNDNFHEPTQKEPAAVKEPAVVVGAVVPDTAPEMESRRDAAVGSASVSMTTTSSFAASKIAEDLSPSLPSRLQDRYVFRSLLGLGGFGAVYEAWDEVLQRVVAIKVARRDRFDGTSGRQQFLDEARAAAKLKHPHIVTVFDSGSDAEGNPFVVFELIAGESLAERMKRQPLSQHEAIVVMTTVAEAVHAAHKRGLVHRDLKPPNILLDAAGQPHVTDFGLAVDEHSQRDMAGEVAGSPQYMSPEQVRGETQYLDGRTDVWSLGVILYELLAHRRPFTGRNINELRDEILHREPKPLRQIDESISVELDDLCSRCMRKNITERWSSAVELATRLRQQLAPSDKPTTPVWQSRKFQVVAALMLMTTMIIGTQAWLDSLVPSVRKGSESPAVPATAVNPSVTETKNAEGGQVIQSPPRRPIPGRWFRLLTQAPEFLLWPNDPRNSKFDHHPDDQELWLTCGSSGLVKLGEASGDFEIQLNLHQSPWAGDVGLFLGMQDAERDGVPVQRYQCIELTCVRSQKESRAYLNRVQIDRRLTDSKSILNRQTPAAAEIPVLGDDGEDLMLRVTISGGRVSAIRWKGQSIPDLVGERLDPLFPKSAQQGAFGLFLNQSSVVIRRAEILIPLGESP